MPKVCYYKPNRSKIRHFSDRDVGRIARYAIRDGADPISLLAAVLSAVGWGGYICKAAKVMASIKILLDVLVRVGGALALAKLIDRLIQLLSRNLLFKLPWLRVIVIAVLAALASLGSVMNALETLENEGGDAQLISELFKELCSRVDVINK